MITQLTRQYALPLFIFLLLSVSLACNTISGGVPNEAADNSDEQVITLEQDITFGPGSFGVPDMTAGLSDLPSYKATLTTSFDGTRDGKAITWSKVYVMLTTTEPAGRQFTIEKSGDLASLDPLFMAELDGASYEKRGQADCEMTAIEGGESLAEGFEPASFLGGVFGAEEAGSETVNDVAANHYTFDQRALGEDGITESSGEFWLASEGGYLIKYVLTKKAKADYFGEGVEGTVTLEYELTGANHPVEITLPEDCPPGFVDAPRLPDASNISNTPGVLAYDTSTTIADAAAFYQQNIPDLGWEAQEPPTITDAIVYLPYVQGNKTMFIIIKSIDARTEVRITVSKVQESLTP